MGIVAIKRVQTYIECHLFSLSVSINMGVSASFLCQRMLSGPGMFQGKEGQASSALIDNLSIPSSRLPFFGRATFHTSQYGHGQCLCQIYWLKNKCLWPNKHSQS